jgi:hypothetical protein
MSFKPENDHLAQNGGKRRRPTSNSHVPPQYHDSSQENRTGSPWQAFKRLRVTHAPHQEERQHHLNPNWDQSRRGEQRPSQSNLHGIEHYRDQPDHCELEYRQQHHGRPQHQTAGESSYSESGTHRGYHSAAPARESIADLNYSTVNSVLGQMHRQRLHRERGTMQDAQLTAEQQHYGNGFQQSARYPLIQNTAPVQNGQPSKHHRKVVRLQTNSKLG